MGHSCCIAEIGMDSESQMQLLFAELKRIEGQQHQLKTAVAQNRVLVVHPPKGFDTQSVEDEYAEEKVIKPDPDRFIPSGMHAGDEICHCPCFVSLLSAPRCCVTSDCDPA